MTFRDFYGVAQPQRVQRVEVVDGEVVYSPSFGDAPPAPLTEGEKVYLKGKMDATVAAIRAAFVAAQARVAVTPNAAIGGVVAVLTGGLSLLIPGFSAPTATKDSVSNTLTALRKTFESTIVDAIPRVLNGEMPAQTWFNKTKGYVDSIVSILDELRVSGITASLKATFDGMVNDTAEFLVRFKKGVEKTFDFMPVIVGGAALLAVYLIVTKAFSLVPGKRFSGYPHRRKLRRGR